MYTNVIKLFFVSNRIVWEKLGSYLHQGSVLSVRVLRRNKHGDKQAKYADKTEEIARICLTHTQI